MTVGTRFLAAGQRLRSLPWRSIAGEAFDRALAVGKALCVLHVVDAHVGTIAFAVGASMLPTLNLTGDVIAIDRLTTKWRKVAVGDVVLVNSPENPRKTVIKRVVALAGETVSFLVDPANSDESRTTVVPKGHVWVQGDNIYNSRDSRQFGPVSLGLLRGRIFGKVWPPSQFGFLDSNVKL